jgi:hypothetical protein
MVAAGNPSGAGEPFATVENEMPARFLMPACLLVCVVSCQDKTVPKTPTSQQVGNSSKTDPKKQNDVANAAPASGSRLSTLDSRLDDEPEKLLHPDDVADGWISLFDGRTLFGWQANNDREQGGVNWRVEDGVITADEGEPGLLLTTVRFTDFELLCQYRLAEGGNSGIFLRTVFNPTDAAVDCYELNMCDTHPAYPTGSIVGRQQVEMETPGEGQWRSFRVRVEGNQIVVKLDGRIVMDFVDESENRRPIGFIGLQKNEGKIEFRDIALRPLGTSPLFDDETLAGWREVPGSSGSFLPAEGTIHVKGGPGFLETEAAWADFVLQFDVRTNVKDANGGVFFRAMPGTKKQPSNGYELQICNSFADGNRAKPNDFGTGFGTGAIMHRMAARYIVADDEQWMTMTLIADGPRFSTWVNGFQTAHWVDDRDSSDNPRDGKRLAAGHISLQGHDKTTDVSFRNLRIISVANRATPTKPDRENR